VVVVEFRVLLERHLEVLEVVVLVELNQPLHPEQQVEQILAVAVAVEETELEHREGLEL
jgi:hypothetical protein